MKTLSKIISTSGVDIKFVVDVDVCYCDDARILIEMSLKSSRDDSSTLFLYKINKKKLTLTSSEVDDVKKLIQEFEQETINLINRRKAIDQQISAVFDELSYNQKL